MFSVLHFPSLVPTFWEIIGARESALTLSGKMSYRGIQFLIHESFCRFLLVQMLKKFLASLELSEMDIDVKLIALTLSSNFMRVFHEGN